MHDSIVIREVIHDGGDTVEVTKWRTRWRDRIVHDTVIEHVTDTVRITDTLEVEKTVEVPKEGGKAGWIVAVVLALVMIFQTVIKTTLKR